MEQTASHDGLALRLREVADSIARLKREAKHAQGIARVEETAALEELERRYVALEARLREIEHQDPGFQRGALEEFEKFADDLAGSVERFFMKEDSKFEAAQRAPDDA